MFLLSFSNSLIWPALSHLSGIGQFSYRLVIFVLEDPVHPSLLLSWPLPFTSLAGSVCMDMCVQRSVG